MLYVQESGVAATGCAHENAYGKASQEGEQAPVTSSSSDSMALSCFNRVAKGIDTAALVSELAAAPELWLADTSRQRKVRCQRDTQNIFLRVAKKSLLPGASNANDVHDSRTTKTARCFPETLAFCRNIADLEGGELGRATLVALQPGGWVRPHKDLGDYYRVRDRYHLVLQSLTGSPLTCAGETVMMHAGELWVFDNKSEHEARNLSATPRVHLIFDILPTPGCGYYV